MSYNLNTNEITDSHAVASYENKVFAENNAVSGQNAASVSGQNAASAPVIQNKPSDLQVELDDVNQIVESIVYLLDGRKLTSGMVIRVVANCMTVAAKMKLSNNVKKKIVIGGIEKFIREKSGLSDDEVNTIMSIVDIVVDDAVDTLADVANGNISFKKSCCFCF